MTPRRKPPRQPDRNFWGADQPPPLLDTPTNDPTALVTSLGDLTVPGGAELRTSVEDVVYVAAEHTRRTLDDLAAKSEERKA